jgi:hypothetical protein
VAELADATDSKSVSRLGSVGSSPTFGIGRRGPGAARGRRLARGIGWGLVVLGLAVAAIGFLWWL